MTIQPPQELFCMNCGPSVAVERRHGVLRCPHCGDEQQVPDLPLFVVTGASGTGKSTVTAPLRRQLPDCEVFETDALLPVAALGLDAYRGTWLRLAHDIALNGRVTVLTGSLLPSQLESLPGRKLIGPIRFCTLDCPDAVIAERLGSRPSWRFTSKETEVAEHQRFAAWLRTHIQPCYDTSLLSPAETAGHIATWVRQNVADLGLELRAAN
jgi:gluconate kinase